MPGERPQPQRPYPPPPPPLPLPPAAGAPARPPHLPPLLHDVRRDGKREWLPADGGSAAAFAGPGGDGGTFSSRPAPTAPNGAVPPVPSGPAGKWRSGGRRAYRAAENGRYGGPSPGLVGSDGYAGPAPAEQANGRRHTELAARELDLYGGGELAY
eukprot:SM007874S22013  [mRNA]  locus=s7874:77:650:- [translate_table: standard]